MCLSLHAAPTGCMLAHAPAAVSRVTLPPRSGRRPTRRCAAANSFDAKPTASRPVTPAVLVVPEKPVAEPVSPVEDIEEPVPFDVLNEFEHKLEADLKTVGVTLTAVTGVIVFWRGIWSLLDYFLEDSLFGDICCIIVGLTIVLWIRLTGVKVSPTFWPPS